ncbi:MAG: T9SS type A sorting domain-containing protein [Candidatus Latescibacterota bacterium]|nr:MAG: T9SS type A sorting domain-containing protein [Candidatus Latescibacterota bacterium]
MKTTTVVALCVFFAMTVIASAKETSSRFDQLVFKQSVIMPANPPATGGSMFSAAAAGTTLLGWWQFDTAMGMPDEQGWTYVDKYAQFTTYFHVDGNASGDPDCHGIQPVSGSKSMWCGQWATPADPWCSWLTLPGYGNGWDQSLVSQTVVADTLVWSWTAMWDSETLYDFTFAEYYDAVAMSWVPLPVNGGAGGYDGSGGPLNESYQIVVPGGTTQLRFHVLTDGVWSDEDAGWPTNEGAFKVDDISVVGSNGFSNGPQTFETDPCNASSTLDGFWTAQAAPSYGVYAQLHSAATVVQEDPCLRPLSNMWGFFDDPLYTDYSCGGWPLQGAVPYGPDDLGLYMWNEIWSPWIPNSGSGSNYQIEFLTYRDLPLDNLVFYIWEVRSRDASGCSTPWDSDFYVYFGDQKDWFPELFQIGSFIAGDAAEIQIALGAIDMCPAWCGVYGSGACHSHAPIIDQVKFYRLDFEGPQWNVRDIDLFQDTFPENGEVVGVARCDMPQDILPGNNGSILPGDSLAIEVTDPNGIGMDPTLGGPSVYLFARVTDRFGVPVAGKSGLAIQSPDNVRYAGDPNAGVLRYPQVGPASSPTGLPAGWSQFRMDDAFTPFGGPQPDKYCADLMDVWNGRHVNEDPAGNVGIFSNGDVINYFLGAMNTLGQWSFFHRTIGGQGALNVTTDVGEAAGSPMEWSVLPDAGRAVGELGDILFVDDADDRGGPAQRYFDWAFKYLGLENRVDRFDVIGPSSNVGNSLASRVKDVFAQIIGDPDEVYQKILWNSSNLTNGLIGDGGAPNGGSSAEKSDDYQLLYVFLNHHPGNPGVYAAGDDMIEEWATLAGAGAINVRSTFMNHTLVSGDHTSAGEPVSPLVTRSGGSPIGPDAMVAFGGCPLINDFDVGAPTGLAFSAMEYETPGKVAVLAQATPNAAGSTARYVLSGFAYNYIRDDLHGQTAPDRVLHLRDILVWLENIVGDPIGVDPVAFENRLDDNFPNPFNPTTTIRYSVAEQGRVTLRIYNAAGQLIRTLVDKNVEPAQDGFVAVWNGMNNLGHPVASGVYFYKLTAPGFAQTKKMVLLK